ncbi:hypothetical protein CONLIGDRAFT_637938 [Coniochaeta ligniaria NRRL 30616]|uniref:F-box domain-containing protein n=1 Tax=Coniochaeta ligniaria NRRL 30616 TaxID=1408157 RepID=A0A1J7I5U9_9PEZI|nr:hypothetical protein CONLIGDRAFT_637938 [Coniochaeta ligniaria NRRL 30616]
MDSSSLPAMQSQPGSLPDCPAEMLRAIFESVSRADLQSLCLTCRAIRPHAEALLYSRVDLVWLDEIPPILLLLRTILARPDLAKHVKTVDLSGDLTQTVPRFTHYSALPRLQVSPAELGRPIAFVEALGLPAGSKWVEELRSGAMDAFVAVFLSQLCNVQTLAISGNFSRHVYFVGEVFRSALCGSRAHGLPSFEYLRQVSIRKLKDPDENGNGQTRNTESLIPLFYLPGVEDMTLAFDNPLSKSRNDFAPLEWPGPERPVPSRLKTLNLTLVREPYLGQLLSVTTEIESLTWEWYYEEDSQDNVIKPVVDLDHVINALSHMRASLKCLTISALTGRKGFAIEEPPIEVTGSLQALSEFTALRRLQIPLPFLAASLSPHRARPLASSLPRNLENLIIKTDFPDQSDIGALWDTGEYEWTGLTLVRALRLWLRDLKNSTPYLRGFHLIVSGPNYLEWASEMADEVVQLGNEAGIHTQITLDGYHS